MKNHIAQIFLAIILLGILLTGCLHTEIFYYGPQTMLPGMTADMKRPGFWVNKLENPDALIMTEDEITLYNQWIDETMDTVKDLVTLDLTHDGQELIHMINEQFDWIKRQKLYFEDGKRVTGTYFEELYENVGSASIPDIIDLEFGFVNCYANQRCLPSDRQINDIAFEKFFDSAQMSALDIATPLAILHETADREWLFVRAPLSDGWIKRECVTRSTREELIDYITGKKYVIVTNAKAEIFMDESMMQYLGYARMGTKFIENPDSDTTRDDIVEVLIPDTGNSGENLFKPAYVFASEISRGYLPYTSRNVIYQAFKLQHEPYGWGGMFGEQDCSRFICQVFSSFGIRLPRNSFWQTQIGIIAAEYDRESSDYIKLEGFKENITPGITLLRIPGHIMLYLGLHNDSPYVIHSVWAYSVKQGATEKKIAINNTVVSGLNIGEDSKKGSFLSRLRKAITIRMPDIALDESSDVVADNTTDIVMN